MADKVITAVKAGNSAAGRLSNAQRTYLERGLRQPGGKLPLFDVNGMRVKAQTIRSCIDHGWCEPWYSNPIKPDWLVCRLTDGGHSILVKRTGVKSAKASK